MKKIVDVSGAIIWNSENKFLICQRPVSKKRSLLWEFVGGKLEEGETKEEALIRECKEEIDVLVKIKKQVASITHEYDDIIVNLYLFNCEIESGEIKMLEHNDIKWICIEQIDDYNFCPADIEILEKLKNKEIRND